MPRPQNYKASKYPVKKSFKKYGKRDYKTKDYIDRQMVVTTSRKFVHLRYVEITTMSLGNGASPVAIYQYNMNNAYDVSAAIGTTIMPGFNEWTGMYQKFRVMASKITMEICNMQANPIYAGMFFNPSNTALPTWANIMESRGNRNSKQVLLQALPGPQSKMTLSLYRKMGDVWGNSKEYNSDVTFTGTASASPATQIPGFVYVLGYTSATNVGAINPCKIEVDMWVDFYEPKVVIN